MKTLGIYCAGGLGRELAQVAARVRKTEHIWNRIVFIDDWQDDASIDGIPVYTFSKFCEQWSHDSAELVISSGEPAVRVKLYHEVCDAGYALTNLFSPGFVPYAYSDYGKGNIIHQGAIATCGIHMGVNTLVNKRVVIGHDVAVGSHCSISPSVTIGGNCHISDRVFIGSGAVLRNGITIGQDSIIGMGAVVTKDVEDNTVVVGNPARKIRDNDTKRVFA